MNEWLSDDLSNFMIEWMNIQINEWMYECIYQGMNILMYGRWVEWTYEWIYEWRNVDGDFDLFFFFGREWFWSL